MTESRDSGATHVYIAASNEAGTSSYSAGVAAFRKLRVASLFRGKARQACHEQRHWLYGKYTSLGLGHHNDWYCKYKGLVNNSYLYQRPSVSLMRHVREQKRSWGIKGVGESKKERVYVTSNEALAGFLPYTVE